MKLFRRLPRAFAVVALVAASLAGATTATALWSERQSVTSPEVILGGVSFAAEENPDPSREYATGAGGERQQNGTPVTVTLPGEVIAQVMQGTVVWRFKVIGYAAGIAGLTYDVSYPTPDDDTPGAMDTLIEGTSMTVYPASGGGDCSNIPDAPDSSGDVVRIEDNVLQTPGSNPSGQEVVQDWCVALVWNADPSRYHTNVATASATAEDGTTVTTSDVFGAYVDYPPSLDPFGSHTNVASVAGTGEDGSIARDDDQWYAIMYPDPANEPDLTITLTPRVVPLETSES